MPILYRQAVAADVPLIVGSWCDALKYSHAAGMIQLQDWDAVMRPQIKQVLLRPNCRGWVAYDPAETDRRFDLYGWIATERGYTEMVRRRVRGQYEQRLELSPHPLVHFVFVKRNYRKEGIARGLFGAAGIDPAAPFYYSCKTGIVSRLASKIPAAEWKPLIARHRSKEPIQHEAAAEQDIFAALQ